MISGDLLREARLRTGLTQAELGRRVGRAQSQIARWERGDVKPSLETLRELLRACGLDLWFRLVNHDDSYLPYIDERLALPPDERVEHALRHAETTLDLMAAAGATPAL
ncbi:MAG: helix-turn-helix domain-containing protein [Actinomycetota bacterium]|nr:helix-turn-helix domain-containing protein [Actinomycetota bacterium]